MNRVPPAGRRLQEQFDRQYRRSAKTGAVDSIGSIEYALLLSAWKKNNCPENVREFLEKHKGILE
jgi:hypothetical protein